MAATSNKITSIDVLTKDQLYTALKESVELQTHYAMQLNCYDGGNRNETFTAGSWILRLRETGKIK
jgi:hypothetical protein